MNRRAQYPDAGPGIRRKPGFADPPKTPSGARRGRSYARLLSLLAGVVAVLGWAAAVVAAPNITGFNRLYGSATNDPNYINIYGSGFYPSTTIKVTFGGAPASIAYPIPTNNTWYIETAVPAAAPAGPQTVVVTVDGSSAQSYWPFYVVGSGPYVAGFSPYTGGDEVTVTVTGLHFSINNAPAVTSVKFNGVAGTGLYVGQDTSLTVATPAGVTTGPIQVTTTAGTFTTSSNYYAPCRITGFSPVSGTPGTTITVTGVNFLGLTLLELNGQAVTPANVSNTSLQFTVPAGALSGPITAATPANPFTTSSNFAILPTITGFVPASGPPGTLVTIQGSNFTDGTSTPTVRIGGQLAAVQGGYSADQVVAAVPAAAATGPVSVASGFGTATSSALFYLPPTLTSFTPGGGPAGTSVQITGTSLTGASAVSFNGVSAAGFTVNSNTSITAVVPAGVITGPISVTTPGGTTNSGTLVFHGAPQIFSLNPAHGQAGTNVVIAGVNLLGATGVAFNGLTTPQLVVSNNQTLAAVAPPNTTSGSVTVTTPGGTAISPSPFTVDTSALGVSVQTSPATITAGGELTWIVTITNGGPYAAPNARLGDMLPSLAALLSKSNTAGGFSTNTSAAVLMASLGSLPAGGSATVTLTTQAPGTPGWVTNVASAGADDGNPQPLAAIVTNSVWVQSAPLLSARLLAPGLVQLSWPSDLTNYQLIAAAAATNSPSSWTNVLPPAALSNIVGGLRWVATQPLAEGARFFRLKE